MNIRSTIVVTGAAGFIGSGLIGFLNEKGYEQILAVDDFSRKDKEQNLAGKKILEKIDRKQFFPWLEAAETIPDFIFHLGARTDTTEFDYAVHRELNLEYSQRIWNYCSLHDIPLIYASSAATYGSGKQGYDDDPALIPTLKPLNPYGVSKNEFDIWVLAQEKSPAFWAGLKFFNVYGPNEYHKGRMASGIFHSFNQIGRRGEVALFRSHRPDFEDGQQLRDFIYVKDIWKLCFWLMTTRPESGIFNLGTGRARSFFDLAKATFTALGMEPNIHFIDMPEDIRDKYQYFTEAKMQRIRALGFRDDFYSLEAGISDYVQHYLLPQKYY